jgi:hypothetical protein
MLPGRIGALLIVVTACGGRSHAEKLDTDARGDARDVENGALDSSNDTGAPIDSRPDAGPCKVVQASSYDRSCTLDSDCVPVPGGTADSCNPNPTCIYCSTATVSLHAEDPYYSDLMAAMAAAADANFGACPPCAAFTQPCCRLGACQVGSACEPPSAPPDAGLPPPDAASPPPDAVAPEAGACTIHASDYDQSCASDSDCVDVSEGDFCGQVACPCPNAAVRVSAASTYMTDLSEILPVSPLVCSCPIDVGPRCDAGRCSRPL